ncbi:MAG: PAS domain S-box protein, partial [Bacteroidales bacterium]|nr:PAS domain S-box protein [Bacteroidales bacterium]
MKKKKSEKNIYTENISNTKFSESRELYQSVVESSLIGIIIIDDKFDIIYANQILSEILGYSNDELLNSKFFNYLAKESRDEVIEKYQLRQKGEDIPSKYQIYIIRKDGEKRLFQISASIVKNTEGKFQTIVHLFDITEEKISEKKVIEQNKLNLLRSQTWKQAVKISIPDKDKFIDELLKIIGTTLNFSRASYFEQKNYNSDFFVINQWLNKDIKSTMGSTISNEIAKHFINKKYVEIPADIDKFNKIPVIKQIIKAYVKFHFKKYDLKNYLVIRLGEPDNPKGLLSFENCRTDRKWSKTEKDILRELADIINIKLSQISSQVKLEESERKYRSIIDNSLEGIYIVQNDNILFCNQIMANMYGYKNPSELKGIDINKFISHESKELVKQKIEERLSNHNQTVHYEYIGLRKDGTKFNVESLGNSITYQGKPAIQGAMRDITKRKETENKLIKTTEELHELNLTKDKFFSIIAHDLKNPFNVILGFSELLVNEYESLNSDEIYIMAQEIFEASNNSFELLENLLQWSRSQMNRINFEPDYFKLIDIVNTNLDLIKSKAKEKNIKIFSGILPNTTVYADKNMISTILRNLLTNALKFTEENGAVYIKARKLEDRVQINITDTGVGIREEDIDKLFKIDSNISTTGTANEKGTGLGLILCKEFVEKNNGTISVESTEGKGSTFTF